ncbi:hypothetical protein CKO51_27220 [Rhodopirellula sp. SM50]|nr:hypothetical protein [Rhodopirellula sp. SM50]PAY16346.1 hypothetical protein CKO51_27220 [Rhodopirellula sp. SM50]
MNKLVEKKVTCPHCWHDFFGDLALYISQHDELFGDPVLGDVHARISPHEVTKTRDGKVLDSKGWEMHERACPNCHLQIPLDLLTLRPNFISIVGAPRSGKTYFLTVMLHELRRTLAKQFRYTLDLCDSHDKKILVANEQTLFSPLDPTIPVMLEKTQEQGGDLYNNVTLDGVRVQLPKPFLLTIRGVDGAKLPVRAKQASIVLYDNAGESFFDGRDNGRNRSTRHLGESNAVLFAYDPLLEPETRLRLAMVSQDPQVSAKASSARQVDFLTETIQRMRKHSGTPVNERLKASLAVCVQKYDVWHTLLDHCRDEHGNRVIDSTSVEFFRRHGVAALDIGEINVVSHIVRGFLNDISPEFVSRAEANFERVRYFPVSALGCSPTLDGEFLKIAPMDLQPFRVDHPALWLMREWRMIARTKDPRPNPRLRPVATLRSVGKRRMEVACPKTGELFVLDHEYAGRDFYNFNTHEYFWIPEINAAKSRQTAEPKVAKTSKATMQGLGLKLGQGRPKPGDERQKKKRGWFR